MSDHIDWRPVLAWTSLVGVQIGTALYNGWKKWRRNRGICDRDHHQLEKGETVDGWNLIAMQSEKFWNKCLKQYVFRQLCKDGRQNLFRMNYVDWSGSSKLGKVEIAVARRFSLISLKVSPILFKIVFDSTEWNYQGSQVIGTRFVYALFHKVVNDVYTGTYRLVIIDVCDRSVRRIFNFRAPDAQWFIGEIIYETDPKPRLIVFYTSSFLTVDQHRAEIHEISYDLNDLITSNQNPVSASSWETISIPIDLDMTEGSWVFQLADQFTLRVIYDTHSLADVNRYRLVSYSRNSGWRLESFSDWYASLQNSEIGVRLLNAFRSIDSLQLRPIVSSMPALTHFIKSWVLDDFVLYNYKNRGYLRRWIRVPGLKLVAAEMLFRANPNLSRDQVKEAVGFDVFEGIPDEKNECPIVYL